MNQLVVKQHLKAKEGNPRTLADKMTETMVRNNSLTLRNLKSRNP